MNAQLRFPDISVSALVDQGCGVLDGAVWVGVDELVAAYVASRISYMDTRYGFGPRDPITHRLPYVALGVVARDRFCGGVVFHDPRTAGEMKVDIRMSGAFEPRSRWATRDTLRKLFGYAFVQEKYLRMTTITSKSNKRAREVDEGLGFKLEGVCEKAIDGKDDAVIYGMMRKNCKFIPEECRHGR